MTHTAEERLATLEQEMRDTREDIKEVKASLKEMAKNVESLAQTAARGTTALNTVLYIGGIIGWMLGLGVMVMNVLAKHA